MVRAEHKPAVLVVEDEAVVAADLRESLEGMGLRVTGVAGTVDAALRLAESDPPDLVLMDVVLTGEGDGVRVARRLGGLGGPAVLYVTAHSDPDTLGRAAGTRPAGYLLKPFDRRQLKAAVLVALANSARLRPFLGPDAPIIPVCSHCGHAHDGEGHWLPLAEHLTRAWGVHISHGICPDCFQRHHPGLFEGQEPEG